MYFFYQQINPSRLAHLFCATCLSTFGHKIQLPNFLYLINAGHDLSLENIQFFKQNIPHLLEVSIGHALICEALYKGLEPVIKQYIERLK